MSEEIEASVRLKVENLNAAGYEAGDDWSELELKFTQTGYRVHKGYQSVTGSSTLLDTGPISISSTRVWFMMKNVTGPGTSKINVASSVGGDSLLSLKNGEPALGIFEQSSDPTVKEAGGATAILKYMLVEV